MAMSALASANALEVPAQGQTLPVKAMEISVLQKPNTLSSPQKTESLEATLERPESFISVLKKEGNAEAVAAFTEGINKLKTAATTESTERAAFFIIHEDGSFKWTDGLPKTIFKTNDEYGSAEINIVTHPEELTDIESNNDKIIEIHTHPTHAITTDTPNDITKSIPPSPFDLLAVIDLERTLTHEASKRVQYIVVTESGTWRYGFKNQEAAKHLLEAQQIRKESLEQLNDPKIRLQADLWIESVMQLMVDDDLGPEFVEFSKKIYQNFHDTPHLSELFLSNPSMVEGILKVDTVIDSKESADFITLIETIEEDQAKAISKIDPEGDGKLLEMPDKGGFDSYLKRWRGLGAYMIKEPL